MDRAGGVRLSHVVDGDRHGSDAVVPLESRVMYDARHHVGEEDIQDGADRQRHQDADGHVALRVLRLLRRRAYRVESQESEEDDGGSPQDAGEAELAQRARIGGDVGCVIFHPDVFPA